METASAQRWTRGLLSCGLAAGPLFVTAFLIQGATREGYRPSRHPVSSLALGPRGWVQAANFAVTGTLVIQTANGDEFRVIVRIAGLFGHYSGQISVSGPGVHTTAIVSTRNLVISDGLVTGQGSGRNGFASYSLSFTL